MSADILIVEHWHCGCIHLKQRVPLGEIVASNVPLPKKVIQRKPRAKTPMSFTELLETAGQTEPVQKQARKRKPSTKKTVSGDFEDFLPHVSLLYFFNSGN